MMKCAISLVCIITVALASCDRNTHASAEGVGELKCPELVRWSEKTGAQILCALPMKFPSRLDQEEVGAADKFAKERPHEYTAAMSALTPPDDDKWLATLKGNGPTSGKLNWFSGFDEAAISKGDAVIAWPIVVQRSNNVLGDRDSILVVFSMAEKPIAYGYFGLGAGAIDKMCNLGFYVPPNDVSRNVPAAKSVAELVVPSETGTRAK